MNHTSQHSITWIAVLRIIACLLVVMAHCCDPFVSGDSVEGFNAGALWGTICRPSVPLFIMLSGALLLPTNLSVGQFYKRRLKRLIIPFVFWSILSPWMFYFFTGAVDTVNPTVLAENHTLLATIQASYMWIINFSYSTVPYWYIYMMIGVYLLIPLISAWIKQATKGELKIVLGIWFFTTIIPYLQIVAPLIGYAGNYGSMGLFGECSWNLFTTFHYMGGFIGYAILAFYLIKYPLNWSLSKSVVVGAVMWIVGFLITLYGFHYTRDNYPENFNMLEIIWSFTSLNVALMTIPFFFVVQKINFTARGWISRLSESTYGIFLIHFIVVHIVFELVFQNLVFSPVWQILVIAIISFVLTTLVTYIIRLVPQLRKLT
ncbi:MAG: acyltransferase [Rikenellaceae bacterium]